MTDKDGAFRGTRKTEAEAFEQCAAIGVHPRRSPLGDSHHTDVPFTEDDIDAGDALAYFLGTLFADIEGGSDDPYWYFQRTSVNEWARVARALRIHGLAICDAPQGSRHDQS